MVLTRYSTTTYMRDDQSQPTGFEYELVSAFAKDMGWKVDFVVKDSTKEVLEDLAVGRAHMAAAGLTITEDRLEVFKFSKPYQKVKQQVVCGKLRAVSSEEDLQKLNLLVVEGTSHEEVMRDLRADHEQLKYETYGDSAVETLEKIWEDRDLCTIIDSHVLSVHRRYFPELRVVYELSDGDELAWALSSVDTSLKKKVDRWISGKGRARISELKNKYYGHVKEFDYYDTKKFLERIETRLPKYKKHFIAAAKNSGFTWEFLAAVAYQESQWDPSAVSPTGVRGLMMLTQAAAKEVGVKDRTDPEESIKGGAKYLSQMLKRLPDYVRDNDKVWFSLASYNVGYYHLRDAMALTVLQNKDPGSWTHLRQVLPLLSKRKYYKNLRYGYARGLEPVIYVSRIRNYHELLLSQLQAQR